MAVMGRAASRPPAENRPLRFQKPGPASPVLFQPYFVQFVPDSAVTKWLGNRTNLEWQAAVNARPVAYGMQLTGALTAIPFLQSQIYVRNPQRRLAEEFGKF